MVKKMSQIRVLGDDGNPLPTLVRRCKKCGYEGIYAKNGKYYDDGFLTVKGKNIFKNKTICPKCNEDVTHNVEFDHKSDECPCIYCVEDRRNEY